MSKVNKRVLLTRPDPYGEQLATKLQPHVDLVTNVPLFTYQQGRQLEQLAGTLKAKDTDIFIFVSKAAVTEAFKYCSVGRWPTSATYLAIGSATGQLAQEAGLKSVKFPAISDSEHLLQLSELDAVANKSIVILRGESGREHIANCLMAKGAKVEYVETYQRTWVHSEAKNMSDQWRKQQINCIVVTSQQILDKIWSFISMDDSQINYWQNKCTWYVVSDRIARCATSLGISNICITKGANDQAIIDAVAYNHSAKGIEHDK